MAENGQQYFLRSSGRVLGPFDLAKLKALRTRGRLSRADEVSTDRRTWEPASTLEEVFAPAAGGRRSAPESPNSAGSEVSLAGGADPESVGPAAWHYFAGGDQQGPVTLAALRSLVGRGALQSDDLVWREGMSDWTAVAELPELGGAPPQLSTTGSPRAAHSAVSDGNEQILIQRTSGMAVTSLILAILGFFPCFIGLPCIPAVIFAGVALSDIGRAQGRLGGKGLAIGGLIVGVVGTVLYSIVYLLWWLGVITSGLLSQFV